MTYTTRTGRHSARGAQWRLLTLYERNSIRRQSHEEPLSPTQSAPLLFVAYDNVLNVLFLPSELRLSILRIQASNQMARVY